MRHVNHSWYYTEPDVKQSLIVEFSKAVAREAAKNPDGVRLPLRLGIIQFIAFKPKAPLVNLKLTKEYGFKVYWSLAETDGYAFRAIWKASKWKLRYQRYWKLETRDIIKAELFKLFSTEAWYNLIKV